MAVLLLLMLDFMLNWCLSSTYCGGYGVEPGCRRLAGLVSLVDRTDRNLRSTAAASTQFCCAQHTGVPPCSRHGRCFFEGTGLLPSTLLQKLQNNNCTELLGAVAMALEEPNWLYCGKGPISKLGFAMLCMAKRFHRDNGRIFYGLATSYRNMLIVHAPGG